MIKFEKVSEKEWAENGRITSMYDKIIIPKRSTTGSAGYDFYSPYEISRIPAHSSNTIPTGIKCRMDKPDEAGVYVLSIYPRSSLGINKGVTLANTVGIVDSDYYGNETNEGHIFITLTNNTDEEVVIEDHEKIVQGIITLAYLTTDDAAEGTRTGGTGSTGM